MASTISWELYRSLLGVLRAGSLSGAARLIGITQPTVGRHIAALEAAMGDALFTRSQTGLLPTDLALSLRAYAEAMESTASALERATSRRNHEVRGVVRLSASDVIGIEVLPPIIARLRDQHPGLRIELRLTDEVQDLLRREADIAVRMAQPTQLQLVARRVGRIEIGLFAHERYLERHGEPRSMRDLAHHSVIGFDQETPFIRRIRPSALGFGREHFSLMTDSNVAQLALIRSGAGIGGCQTLLARRDDRLRRVLPRAFSLPLDTWVTMHEGLRDNAACRTTFDALAEGLGHYIEGRWDAFVSND